MAMAVTAPALLFTICLAQMVDFMGIYMEKNGIAEMLRIGYLGLFIAAAVASAIRFFMLEETLEAQPNALNLHSITSQTLESVKSTIFSLSRTSTIFGIIIFILSTSV